MLDGNSIVWLSVPSILIAFGEITQIQGATYREELKRELPTLTESDFSQRIGQRFSVAIHVGSDSDNAVDALEELGIGSQRQERPAIAIHIVLQIEDPRKTGAGGLMFRP